MVDIRTSKSGLGRVGGLIAGIVALLSACSLPTLPSQRRDAELREFTLLLSGTYDNIAQARMDERQGVHPPHDKLTLAIVPLLAPTVGDHVFYMQEMAADDHRRVMLQRVLSVDATELGIVQTQYSLKEPLRWRDGHLNPEVFDSMVPQDLNVLRGCSLIWKKDGEKFTGATTSGRCHDTTPEEGVLDMNIHGELGPDSLSIAEVAADASGQIIRGRKDEPFNRFRKETH
jgi:hypothetical protein